VVGRSSDHTNHGHRRRDIDKYVLTLRQSVTGILLPQFNRAAAELEIV
jgi:hypothetical protein